MLGFQWRKVGVSVTQNFLDTPVNIVADPVQLRQVIVNLVQNAVEAMTVSGDSSKELNVWLEIGDTTVSANFRDNGGGIPPDRIEGLFEPQPSSKPHGSGIGLAISTRIVDTHGGTLQGWNNPNQGATFRLTLPLANGDNS